MRTRLLSLLLLAGSAGCTRYVELAKPDPRIWLISDDQKKIFRCVDLVPPDGKGKHIVECIRANIRDSDRAGREEAND